MPTAGIPQLTGTVSDTGGAPPPAMVPVAQGGALAGSGALLSIWATTYNTHIGNGQTPKNAAKHALHDMLSNGKMHDISQMSYQTPAAADPGSPGGFSFQPGQLFPVPTIGTLQNLPFAAMGLAIAIATGNVIGIVVAVIEVLIDLIQGLINFFEGKPVAEDTELIASRLMQDANPASFISGVQIARNLSQNGIVLSSGDSADQAILGNIRKHGS